MSSFFVRLAGGGAGGIARKSSRFRLTRSSAGMTPSNSLSKSKCSFTSLSINLLSSGVTPFFLVASPTAWGVVLGFVALVIVVKEGTADGWAAAGEGGLFAIEEGFSAAT